MIANNRLCFTKEKLNKVIKYLKISKAVGVDGIFPEFLKYVEPRDRN